MLAVQNLVPLLLAASVTLASPIFKRYTGFTDPAAGGGSSIGYFPGGTSGEPLNVIISSESAIETSDGFANWYKSIGFGKECFGLHSGDAMQANLGDGRGAQNQTGELRESYGEDPDLEGSCLETFKGGNHFRFWKQSTTQAWFLAASVEEDLTQRHTVAPNGYDLGRDWIVGNATAGSEYDGQRYAASVEYVTGLLPTGADGINHAIALDGRTAVLTVTLL